MSPGAIAGRLFSLVRRDGVPADLAWITPGLAWSERFAARQSPGLVRTGVGAVLDLRPGKRHDLARLGKAGLHYLHLAIDDGATPATEEVARAAGWVRHELDDERKVLVHSHKASNGGATVIVATLVRLGHPLAEALTVGGGDLLNESQTDLLRRYADAVGR